LRFIFQLSPTSNCATDGSTARNIPATNPNDLKNHFAHIIHLVSAPIRSTGANRTDAVLDGEFTRPRSSLSSSAACSDWNVVVRSFLFAGQPQALLLLPRMA